MNSFLYFDVKMSKHPMNKACRTTQPNHLCNVRVKIVDELKHNLYINCGLKKTWSRRRCYEIRFCQGVASEACQSLENG